MSSSPNSPRPHRAVSSQGPLFESEAMTSRASIASHIRSRSWRTVEDGEEEASQIDLSIDSSTEVGLEFGDDGSVRLILLSSGEREDRRSKLLPHVSEKQIPIPIIDTSVASSLLGSDVPYIGNWDGLPAPEKSMYAKGRLSKQEQETAGVPLPSSSGESSHHLQNFGSDVPYFGNWDGLPAPETDSMYTEIMSSKPEKETAGVPLPSSSGESRDRRSSPLLNFGSWDAYDKKADGYVRNECGKVPLRPSQTLPVKEKKAITTTKRVTKIICWMSSLLKKKRHTVTSRSSVGKVAANSLTSGQTKQSVKFGLGTTNIGLAHIFSYDELHQATNRFKHELADGGFSRVYLGKLQDGRKVAVKVLYEGVPKRMEQFLNEVTVISRLRHKNLVALYGCTDPETQKLLLVYEFVPNGTIADHLHGQLSSLTWDIRMQIAIETAEALSYLHSCEPPIIHRDVKTSNILLDDDYHAKVADLGMCRLVPWDTTSVSTLPQGTVGYRDPEYDELCKLALKSDVYSFGVVLLELISGKPVVDVYREETEIYLFKMAVKKILNKELDQLVDLRLGYGSNSEISRMVSSVAALSCVCLQPKADPRPPMVEVLQILKGIRDGMHYA